MKVAFLTLGCKVNFYETEKMMAQFQTAGFEVVESVEEKPDVYVINTCTVTNMADRKSRQMIHRGKKANPDCLVVAVGCYAQSDGEKLSQDTAIDLVLDNEKKENVVEYVLPLLDHMPEQCKESSYDFTHERTRAFIKVQTGCNQFCSYCIIPFVRGRLKSRPIDEVIFEVNNLSAKGFQEVVVTVIHLSSYGVDLCSAKNFLELEGKYLLSLLEKISENEEIKRIRLGSLEPRIITRHFLEELIKNKKVCPHFHLSLQSGCDATLKRMNRHYSSEEYEKKCRLIREVYKAPAITTDVIVGFPGETNEEFEITEKFLERIELAEMHIFKYSPRRGTKAAEMAEQVPEQVKTARSNVLLGLSHELEKKFCNQFKGKKQKVLFEEWMTVQGEEYLVGHTERYVKVAVTKAEAKASEWQENRIGEVVVKVTLKK